MRSKPVPLRKCSLAGSSPARFARLCPTLLIVGCAAVSSDPGVEKPDTEVELSCNATPEACLSVPSIPIEPHLTHDKPAWGGYPAAEAYTQPSQAGCSKEYVVEMTPADLGGKSLVVEIYWSGLNVPLTPMGLRCDQYSGFVQAYDRADENSPWKLINYRTFKAEANKEGSVCTPILLKSGTDDPEFHFPDQTPRMWFTPSRHPGGIRVVAGMYRDCQPLTLDVSLSEEFPTSP